MNFYTSIKIFLLSLFLVSCNQTTSKKEKTSRIMEEFDEVSKIEVSKVFCITTDTLASQSNITKPVGIDDSFSSFSLTLEKLKRLKGGKPVIDSTVIYFTNPLYQQKISLGVGCLEGIRKTPSVLMNRFFVDDFVYSSIELKVDRILDIYSFGDSLILEFEIIGGSEYNSHYITIVKRIRDGLAYIFFSDGLQKIDLQNKTVISLVERVRIHKQFAVPVYYQDSLFMPVAHYKLSDW